MLIDGRLVLFPKEIQMRRSYRPQLEQLETRSVPSVFLVSNTNDSGPGSLRTAVALCNRDRGTSNLDQISIQCEGVLKLQSPLYLNHTCRIIGPGADKFTVDCQGKTRAFVVMPPTLPSVALTPAEAACGMMSFQGFTIANAYEPNIYGLGGAAIFWFPSSEMCLTDMCFEACRDETTVRGGGAVESYGSLDVTDCMFLNNSCPRGFGPNIYCDGTYGPSILTILNSTVNGTPCNETIPATPPVTKISFNGQRVAASPATV